MCGYAVAVAQSVQTISKLPDELRENSGMAYHGAGVIYFIMDSGNPNKIYRYDTATKVLTSKVIRGVVNMDFEDLAKDDRGNLYIGDIGNNSNARRDLKIYKIPNPEKAKQDTLDAEVIHFKYSNQEGFPPNNYEFHFDAEAMVWWRDSLYLFSKNRTNPYDGWCYMYVLPSTSGNYIAQLRDSVKFNARIKENGWITAADVRADTLLLLSSSKVWLATGFGSSSLSALSWQRYDVGFSQKEAISFGDLSSDIFISDECYFIGNNLYLLDLKTKTDFMYSIQAAWFNTHHTSSHITIEVLKPDEAYIEVTDMKGQTMGVCRFTNTIELGGSYLAKGNYTITLQVGPNVSQFIWCKSD